MTGASVSPLSSASDGSVRLRGPGQSASLAVTTAGALATARFVVRDVAMLPTPFTSARE